MLEYAPVREEVEGDIAPIGKLEQRPRPLVAQIAAVYGLAGGEVGYRCPVRAHGIARGRVLKQHLGNGGKGPSRARHELGARLVNGIERR